MDDLFYFFERKRERGRGRKKKEENETKSERSDPMRELYLACYHSQTETATSRLRSDVERIMILSNLITTNEQSEYGQFTLRRLRTTISFIYLFSETQFFSFPYSFVFSFSLLGKRKMNNQKLAMTMTVKRDYK